MSRKTEYCALTAFSAVNLAFPLYDYIFIVSDPNRLWFEYEDEGAVGRKLQYSALFATSAVSCSFFSGACSTSGTVSYVHQTA
jgi:hypothetical protein